MSRYKKIEPISNWWWAHRGTDGCKEFYDFDAPMCLCHFRWVEAGELGREIEDDIYDAEAIEKAELDDAHKIIENSI